MRTIVVKSFLVGTASLAVALALIFSLVHLFGERFEASMFVSAVLGSYGIGSTVSGYLFVQSARYRQALLDLADTHRQLTDAHTMLAERARRDGMTGMLNRTSFMSGLQARAERRACGALLIIDADRFKAINDVHGHMAGDEALVAIVAAIRAVTDEHILAARLGGDEFGICLDGVDAEAAIRSAEIIRRSVASTYFRPDGNRRLPLSVSIGIEMFGGDWSVEIAVRNADRRLYEAKAAGRNCVVAEQKTAFAA